MVDAAYDLRRKWRDNGRDPESAMFFLTDQERKLISEHCSEFFGQKTVDAICGMKLKVIG